MPDIRLRAMEPEDLDSLYRIENDMDLWSVSTTNVPYSKYVLHDYIANASGDIYTDKQVRLMVEDDEQHTIGIVDIVHFSPQHQRAELGIVIQKRYRGKGYGKAVIAKVLDYAYHILHLHQLYAIISARQQFTIDLFTQLGFSKECRLKDWLYDGETYQDAFVLQFLLQSMDRNKVLE